MAKSVRLTPGREGYKILFNENTVIMNYKFAAAAAKYGTKENVLMKSIREDFPGMKEVIISGREQTSAKTNHRLTYENMEKYILVHENAEELLEVFTSVTHIALQPREVYRIKCGCTPSIRDCPVHRLLSTTFLPISYRIFQPTQN